MYLSFLKNKIVYICLLVSLISTALALSDIHSELVKIQFDKTSYEIGESAKVNVIIENHPTNSDFVFTLEGTQVLNGFSSELQFKMFSNNFKALTRSLAENSRIHLKIKLENIKKLNEISKKVQSLEQTIKELRVGYNRNPDSEILRQIQTLEVKIKLLKIERSRNTTVVKELDYKLKINAEGSEVPGQEEDTDSETPISNLVINLEGINESRFNPISLLLKLKTSSAVGFNLADSAPIFTLNGKRIDVENVLVLKNEITFSLMAEEGRNVLSVEGLDGDNNVFHYETCFYSGSRNVSVNIQSSASTGELTAYSGDDPDFKIATTFSGSSVILQNIPNLSMVLDVQTDGNEFAFQVLDIDANATSIDVHPNEEPSQVINDDFSLDSSGWNISSSEFQIINRELNGAQIPNNRDLIIMDSGNQGVEVRRAFLAGHANKFVSLKFNLHSTGDDEVHVVIRNISTGEFAHKVFRGENFQEGPSKIFDVDQSISVKAETSEDIISVYIKSFPQSAKKTSRGRLRKRTLKSVSNLILTLNGVFYESFNILGFYAHNIQGREPKRANLLYTSKLSTLSIGHVPFPDFGYKIPFNFRFKKIDYSQIDKVELIVEQPWLGQDVGVWMKGSWEPLPEEAENLSEIYNQRNLPNNPNDPDSNSYNYFNKYVRYAIEKISFNHSDVARFDHEKPIRLYLAIYLNNGEVHHADLGRSLTPLEYRSHQTDSRIQHFDNSLNAREPSIGGDSWGQKFVWNFLMDIFKTEDNFGFSINDLSRMQGGHFDPHEGHNEGMDVDYVIQNYFHYNGDKTERWLDDKAVRNTIKLLSETKTSEGERVLRFVDKVFISYSTEREKKVTTEQQDGTTRSSWKTHAITELTDIKRDQRAGCSVDNRTIRTIVRPEFGHVNHGHISFRKKPTPSLSRELFASFIPFYKRSEENRLEYEFEALSSNFHGDEQFIWDIRKTDNTMVEVIDDNTQLNSSSTRGILLSKNSNNSGFRYRFPEDGKYILNLVVARDFSDDPRNPDERCTSQSFEILVKADNIVNCEGEWQTPRGREVIDPISGHKHLGGALVSKDTDFRAGRFFVEDDSSAICKKSVIVDGYSDSAGCTEENKYSCASILIRGLVGVINSTIDGTQGNIRVAGTEQPFIGYPMIQATDPANYIGTDDKFTLITDSIITAQGYEPIVIINSDIDGDGGTTLIDGSAFIQQSNVWWATVGGESRVMGGIVAGFKNPNSSYDPLVSVKGKSVVKGYVGSESRLDIVDSVLEKTGYAFGGGLIRKSLLQGVFFGSDVEPSEFETTRIAKLDDSAIVLGSSMGGRGQVLNKAIIGSTEVNQDQETSVAYNVTVKDGAWIFGGSTLIDNVQVKGSKVKAFSIEANNDSIIDSTIGGTNDQMLLEVVKVWESQIYGTPSIYGSIIFRSQVRDDALLSSSQLSYGIVRDQAESVNSILGVLGSGNKEIVVSGQSKITDSWVNDEASVGGMATVSGRSAVGGSAVVTGTSNVTNGCILTWGSWSSGIFSGNSYPCNSSGPAKSKTIQTKIDNKDFEKMRKDCSSIPLKDIKNKKKRISYNSFSQACNDIVTKAQNRKPSRSKLGKDLIKKIELETKSMIKKSLKPII